MKSNGVVDIAGMLTLAGTFFASMPYSLSQTLGEMQIKPGELTIAPGGAFVSIPLNLSAGVTEALFLLINAPASVRVEETTADDTLPGPAVRGLKGLGLWTYSLGEGLVTLRIANPDPIDEVHVSYVIAAQGTADDIPPFWDE